MQIATIAFRKKDSARRKLNNHLEEKNITLGSFSLIYCGLHQASMMEVFCKNS